MLKINMRTLRSVMSIRKLFLAIRQILGELRLLPDIRSLTLLDKLRAISGP